MNSLDTPASPGGYHSENIILIAAVAIHCCMLLSLGMGFLNPLFDDAMHRSGQAADFFAVYQAGTNLVDGVSVYSTSPDRQSVPYYYPYRYHPFVALTLGLAIQPLPPFVAYGIWIVLLELILLVNLKLTWSLFDRKSDAVKALVLWLVFSPMYLELYMGQFSYAMASIMFWCIIAWARGKRLQGDLWWSLSLVLKSNSALFAPVLLRERKWLSIFAAGGAAVLAGLPYFLAVPGSYPEFAQNYTARMTVSTLLGNQGFAALMGMMIVRASGLWTGDLHVLGQRVPQMDQLMEVPILMWTMLIIGTALYVTFKSQRPEGPEFYLLWLLAYVLFYKHVWEHQYVMLLPVFALLYWRMTRGGLNLSPVIFWSVFAVVALPTVFVFLDRAQVLFDPELSWNIWESVAFHAPKPLAVLVLFAHLSSVLLKPFPRFDPAP
ncbi:MAG: hypothetical protein HBSIN02_19670 [Bacteroidia bacterium]|nr:MAG: hypothetical protein HBSIN02_19670 [Bacteroidia bacterium]